MISVIVPVYNVSQYLRRCIDSILSQTYNDLELILVDDGSTDESPRICDEYAILDSRIVVIHKENGGVSKARNTALDAVRGEYIVFCDSDDYLDTEYLERQYSSLMETNSDYVVCNFQAVADNDEVVKSSAHDSGTYDLSDCEKKWNYLIEHIFGKKKHGWEVCLRILKTHIIKDNNIQFPTTCENYAEDLGFTLNYLMYCNRVTSIEYAGYFYFLRSDSMMRQSKSTIKLNQLNEVSYWFCPKFENAFSGTKIKEYYPIIHFLILWTEYPKIIGTPQYSELGQYINSLKKYDFFNEQIKKIKKLNKTLMKLYGKSNAQKICLFSHYCCHKNFKRFTYESAISYRFFIK